jgi:hypothetical protein
MKKAIIGGLAASAADIRALPSLRRSRRKAGARNGEGK